MSASGLIYAAIAVMWAAVLIPMWLRNHDNAAENRSVERFGQAMRVLSRKEREDRANRAFDDQQTSVWRMDHHVEWTEARVVEPEPQVQRPEARRPEAPRAKVHRPEMRRAKAGRQAPRPRTLAQRRARTLTVLAGLTVLTLLAAVVGVLPFWTALPFVAMLGSFVVHLRIQARQREQRRPVRRPNPALAERPVVDQRDAEARPQRKEAPRRERVESMFVPGPSRAMVVETKGAGRTAVGDDAGVDSRVETGVDAGASEPGDHEETWRPEPLPLPTYVTAPKAMRPIKVIDLTTPGAWSSGRLLDDGLAEEDLLAAQVEGEELDALLEHEAAPEASGDTKEGNGDRRAVGD